MLNKFFNSKSYLVAVWINLAWMVICLAMLCPFFLDVPLVSKVTEFFLQQLQSGFWVGVLYMIVNLPLRYVGRSRIITEKWGDRSVDRFVIGYQVYFFLFLVWILFSYAFVSNSDKMINY